MNRRDQIESLLNMNDPITKRNYNSWDKGDCSEVGLCEILLSQLIREHRQENAEWSNTDYNEIKLRYE
jgi:L-lactate utilization protein LutB